MHIELVRIVNLLQTNFNESMRPKVLYKQNIPIFANSFYIFRCIPLSVWMIRAIILFFNVCMNPWNSKYVCVVRTHLVDNFTHRVFHRFGLPVIFNLFSTSFCLCLLSSTLSSAACSLPCIFMLRFVAKHSSS